MTLFEYLAIAYSLVLSFAVLRVLPGIPFAMASERRYWVHLVFVGVQLLVTAVAFWNGWALREATWTLPKFILFLSAPSLIYFNACTLMPEQASSVHSWRTYYFSVRRRYFMGVIAHTVVATAAIVLVLDLPLFHPTRVPALAGIAGAVVGASSSSARVHAVLATVLISLIVIAGATVFLEPGSYTQ
jgi:hypothetical protein